MVDPEFPASLSELPEPELPGPSWARIAVTAGGICGSDLHLFAHNTGPSPTLASIGTFPFVLGHETAGRVVEAGPGCSIGAGTRVVVDPCIPCLPRGIDPPCANCARGWTSSCLNLDSRVLTLGPLPRLHPGPRWRLGGLGARARVHAPPAPRRDRRPGRQPLRAGLHRLSRPHAGHARGRRPRARGRRGHHRTGRPRRAARAVPALPGHRAGPAPPPGRGGRPRAGRTTSCSAIPTTGTGRSWPP